MQSTNKMRFAAVAGTCLACMIAFAGITAVSAGAEEQKAAEDTQAQEVIADAAFEYDQYGVIDASYWADKFPLEYNSYLKTAMDVPLEYGEYIAEGNEDTTSVGTELLDGDYTSTKVNFLDEDQYPEIKTLGKGYGYAKYYTEPGGHAYSLWVVANNGRLGDLSESKGKVSCYACKTPQVHYDAANYEGEGSYWTQSIQDYQDAFTENVSCANCHENEDPTTNAVLREDWIRAMGDDLNEDTVTSAVCGQCHCDYSMAPTVEEGSDAPFESGEPVSPYYGGTASMNAEDALAFYDEYGFSDWTYASTGAEMLAVRHAEYEFNYGANPSPMGTMGYECADCHMGTVVDEETGVEYTNHDIESPLDNEALLATCNTSGCHSDLASEVKEIQEDIDGRTHELGLRAEQFIFNFEDKVAKADADGNLAFDMDTALANGLTEDQVTRLQQIQRYACYYWNLAAAENSEGAHNPDLYNDLLEKGNALLDEADEILGVSSVVDA